MKFVIYLYSHSGALCIFHKTHGFKKRKDQLDMKKTTASIAAVLACAMMFTGCSDSLFDSSSEDSTTTSVQDIWTAKDEDIVAWATSDSLSAEEKEYYNITFKDFYSEYAFTISNYGLDETSSDYEQYAKHYRQNIIDMLSNEKIILKKAEELGLDKLTEDEMKEIDKAYQENLDGWYETFETQAKEALGMTEDTTSSETEISDDDKAKLLEKEKELFRDYVSGFGLTEEVFLKWQTNTFIQKKVLEYVYKDIVITDEQVDEYVTKLIDEAKKAYKENVSSYERDSEYQKVWLPEGSRNIKYICIKLNPSDSAELSAARNESGADIDSINKQRDEKLEEIKSKAEAALKKATEGTDFDAVIKEYSSDYSETTEGDTTLIINGTTAMYDVLYDELYKLEKPGDISGLIPTDRGYYIIQYTSDAVLTDKEIAEYKTEVKETLTANEQEETANSAIEQWRNDVGYEYDYTKLNFEKPEEETSSDASSDEASDASSAS